mmetsp:Transcript_98575/g.234806  ORF Transcript_98575/g.234806 Transcript_98575/m.234806 type:complete len:249 (-) Transcript_98575:641-1387(-)
MLSKDALSELGVIFRGSRAACCVLRHPGRLHSPFAVLEFIATDSAGFDLFLVEQRGEIVDLRGGRASFQVRQDQDEVSAMTGQRLHEDVSPKVLGMQASERQSESIASKLASQRLARVSVASIPVPAARLLCILCVLPGFSIGSVRIHRCPTVLPSLALHTLWHSAALVRDLEDYVNVPLLQLHGDVGQRIRNGAPGQMPFHSRSEGILQQLPHHVLHMPGDVVQNAVWVSTVFHLWRATVERACEWR